MQHIIVSIVIFYAILILVNVPAPFIGLKFDSGETPKLWFAPPGYVIPIVWFVLFALFGVARHKLIQSNHPEFVIWLYMLAFLCATYAYYTLGLAKITTISALWFGLIGNVFVIALAVIVVYKLMQVTAMAAWLTLPVIIWTLYATLIVLGEMRLAKLI